MPTHLLTNSVTYKEKRCQRTRFNGENGKQAGFILQRNRSIQKVQVGTRTQRSNHITPFKVYEDKLTCFSASCSLILLRSTFFVNPKLKWKCLKPRYKPCRDRKKKLDALHAPIINRKALKSGDKWIIKVTSLTLKSPKIRKTTHHLLHDESDTILPFCPYIPYFDW